MPAWNELLDAFTARPLPERGAWLQAETAAALSRIATRRDSNVLFYATAFLQKPQAPGNRLSIDFEDLNGFMSILKGMNFGKRCTLLLHTPGGSPNAASTIHDYLRKKFPGLEVVVPTYAMSAGTMISLGSDRVVMGRQSQLGPIDPQMRVGSSYVSAQAILDQFELAKEEILSDIRLGHAWAPILQSIGPALIQEAKNALKYAENLVAGWLRTYMLGAKPRPGVAARAAARHFNKARLHMSHGRRIDRDEARGVGIVIEDLEADQNLQDDVLTAYHLFTIAFEQSPATKMIHGHTGRMWVKNWQQGSTKSP